MTFFRPLWPIGLPCPRASRFSILFAGLVAVCAVSGCAPGRPRGFDDFLPPQISIAQATSMMIDLLEWDDDKMGDQLEIHYVVFTTSYIICSLAMSPVSSELSALP